MKYPYFYWIEKALYDVAEDKTGTQIVDFRFSERGTVLYKIKTEIAYQ